MGLDLPSVYATRAVSFGFGQLESAYRANLVALATKSAYAIRRVASEQVDELRGLVQRLFRRFGTLGADTTPCGKPLSIAHAHALMILLGRSELTQRELGAELCIDKSNVARLCAKMVDDGHAVQTAGVQDRRNRVVALTPAGKRLAREVNSASRQRFETLLAGLDAGQRTQVLKGLSQLVAAIEANASEPREEDASE
jgi:DNA-binding MarR family transcriptional regulator